MAAAPTQASHVASQSLKPDVFYVPELDTLRFLAFSMVFVYHLCLTLGARSASANVGSHGVDLFFALSAYLITELMLREKERYGRLDVKAFYVRRILRIWPLYFTFLTVMACLAVVFPSLGIRLKPLGMYALFVGSFPLLRLMAMSQYGAIVGPLWSISIEEQFYLTWPLIVRNISRRGVGITAALIWLICIVVRWWVFVTGHGIVALTTLTHFDSIPCGLLIASFQLRITSFRPMLWIVAACCWFGATSYILSSHPDPILMTLSFVLIALGSGAFLLATIGAAGLRNPWSIYLGRISYGLYIYHSGMIIAVLAIFGLQPTWFKWSICPLLALAMTIALAALSYRWLETPFLRLKARYQHVRSAAPVT